MQAFRPPAGRDARRAVGKCVDLRRCLKAELACDLPLTRAVVITAADQGGSKLQDGRRIDRDELYRLVCEAPLSKVGPQLGIQSVALAALCRAHQIPYPGSGHWTRQVVGS